MKTPWFPVKPSDTHKNPFSWKSELTWTKKKKENFVSLKSLIQKKKENFISLKSVVNLSWRVE